MPDETQPTPEPRQSDVGAGSVEVAPGVTLPGAVLRFDAVRSSGPGGQNVNRRATKVELRVFVDALPLGEAAKRRLRKLAGPRRLVGEPGADELRLVSQEGRTQGANRRHCLGELGELISRARKPPKVRRPTAPSRGSRERRLSAKRERSELKEQRRRNRQDGW